MKLRPYQQSAVDAVYRHLRDRDDNPVVVLPTGAGKSLVIAQIVSDAVNLWNGRVLILAHVKELLEQNADKIRRLCPDIKVGMYSAGLNRRDTETPVVVAGIQSIYKRASDLGPFDLIIVDESHLISTDGDGMYRQFLSDCKAINPHSRVIGLTATPYRMDSGLICSPDHFLNHVCFEIGIRQLIDDRYLSPLLSKAGSHKPDFANLHVRAGEFVSDEIDLAMNQPGLVSSACKEIVEYTLNRNAVLIFASSVAHGHRVVQTLEEQYGIECGFVTGATPARERDELLARFRGEPTGLLIEPEPLKYLCNVNVLTTGFDAPRIDCVVMLRPTMSPGLLYQCVGRGFRLHPTKQNCLILDFGGNLLRHGPIDQLRPRNQSSDGCGVSPAKECSECHSVVAINCSICPDCGHVFPPADRKPHEEKATNRGVLSGEVTEETYEVLDTAYRVHHKRGADDDAPRSMRVEYQVAYNQWHCEFICVEHSGFARAKAVAWWRARSPDPVPSTAEQAVAIANAGGLAITKTITVRSVAGEKYDRIVRPTLGELPEPVEQLDSLSYLADDDDVPF